MLVTPDPIHWEIPWVNEQKMVDVTSHGVYARFRLKPLGTGKSYVSGGRLMSAKM